MNLLAIYDSDGTIYSIMQGDNIDAPKDLPYVYVNVPDGSILSRIDVSNPESPVPVFTYTAETEKQVERINFLEKIMGIAACNFTDEQALEVPELYAEWSGESVSYKTGSRVRHNEVLYKVLQGHVSQSDWTPETAPSLFAKVLITDPNVIPEWEQPGPENAYQLGDKVTHNGKTWESTFDGDNVWEPGVVGTEACWKEVVTTE